MPAHLKLISESETEAYFPAAACYISLRDDGTIIIKKESGQECLHCHSWNSEASKIRNYKARGQIHLS